VLRVSELPVTRWPPGADVDLHWPAAWTRYLAFIYLCCHLSFHSWRNIAQDLWGSRVCVCVRKFKQEERTTDGW